MDSVQGDCCPILIINLAGFILAACRCAVKNIEGRGACRGDGRRGGLAPPGTEQPFQRRFHADLSMSQPKARPAQDAVPRGRGRGWGRRGSDAELLPLRHPPPDPARGLADPGPGCRPRTADRDCKTCPKLSHAVFK